MLARNLRAKNRLADLLRRAQVSAAMIPLRYGFQKAFTFLVVALLSSTTLARDPEMTLSKCHQILVGIFPPLGVARYRDRLCAKIVAYPILKPVLSKFYTIVTLDRVLSRVQGKQGARYLVEATSSMDNFDLDEVLLRLDTLGEVVGASPPASPRRRLPKLELCDGRKSSSCESLSSGRSEDLLFSYVDLPILGITLKIDRHP